MHARSTRRMHDLGPALSGYQPVRWPEVTALASAQRGQDTYTVPMHCSNCGHRWTARLPKGEPAGRDTCPHCGCFTGSRTWETGAPHRYSGRDRYLC